MVSKRNRKSSQGPSTRVFFTTDVHGSEHCFRKFLKVAETYDVDVLIIGGDLAGKVVVPIVRRSDGSYWCNYMGRDLILNTEEELAATRDKIGRLGSYLYETDTDGLEQLRNDHSKVEAVAVELIVERMRTWVKLAEDRLGPTGKKVIMGPGNDDPFAISEILNSSDVVQNPDEEIIWIDEHHEMAGLGYANMTPWKCTRDLTEDQLRAKIGDLVPKLQNVENSIFCFHVPPIDSQLDTCPRLDDSVYPPKVVVDRTGQAEYYGSGSSAVREAIETYQPLLGLHGHIHESKGIARIGRTTCFNPGSEYAEGILHGLILTLTEDSLRSYQFTTA